MFLIAYGIFSPAPLNLVSGILMFPILLYFWIKLTSPEHVGPALWSFRLLVCIIILSILGIGAYFLAIKAPSYPTPAPCVLPSPTAATISPSPSPMVKSETSISDLISPKIKTRGQPAVLYKDPTVDSEVVGSLAPNKEYEYSLKQDKWYKVLNNTSGSGWVAADQVDEIN